MRKYRTVKPFVVVGLIVVLGLLDALVAGAQSSKTDAVDLQFINYIQAGMAEQDVYLQTGDGMGKRVEGSEPLSSITQMLYAASEPHGHDPFGISNAPVGPFGIGQSLGITLGQWLGATGSGTYRRVHDPVYGDTAEVNLTFAGLVSNGVYTLWCSQVYTPPNFKIVNRPCGASDGTENIFVAEENGNAQFELEIGLQPHSTDDMIAMLAIVYHSDGKTYGTHPGDFGYITHVQMFAPLPPSTE